MKSLETLEREVLLLPKEQRFTLAHRILASLEPEAEPGAQAAWDAEIRDRIRQYDAGQKTVVPGEKVFEDIDRRLNR